MGHYNFFCKKCGYSFNGNKYQAKIVKGTHRDNGCMFGYLFEMRPKKGPIVRRVREQIAGLVYAGSEATPSLARVR